MKKDIVRREFLKLNLDGWSYAACQNELSRRHDLTVSISTFYSSGMRFNQGDWDLRDISQRPHLIHCRYRHNNIKY